LKCSYNPPCDSTLTIVLKSILVRHILARVGVECLARQQVTNQAHYSSSRVIRDLVVNEGKREEESSGSAILLKSSRYGHSSFSSSARV